MEHQVAMYTKKLTLHYNQRVADMDRQLKERLTSGAKGQAFAELMSDVDTWKRRALEAESELESVKKELAAARAAPRQQAAVGPKNALSGFDDDV